MGSRAGGPGRRSAYGRMREFLSISRAEREGSPVFIIGAARAGTSLLFRIMQHHSSFVPRRAEDVGVNLVESRIAPFLFGAGLPGDEAPWHVEAFMLFDPMCVQAFAEALHDSRRFRSIARRVPRALQRTRAWSRMTFRDDLLRLFVFYARTARGCDRLIEKTPMSVPFVADIHRALPRAKMLFMARHPLDVLSSYRRRFEFDRAAAWADIDVHTFCDRYAMEAATVAGFADRHPGSLLVVPYDRLTSDPADAARSVCSFIGEPFEPAMLRFTDRMGERTADPLHSDEIVRQTKDWRDFIDDATASLVEERLDEPLRMFGFGRYTRVG